MDTQQAARIKGMEKLLAEGRDGALVRFSLGNAYLDESPALAAEHLQAAVTFDPHYSAAWKLLGKALSAAGEAGAAMTAYRQGIQIAEGKGDLQAAKEMRVFLTRLEKLPSAAS